MLLSQYLYTIRAFLLFNNYNMAESLIKNGFTLPERRKAYRATDVPVSTKEYRRLKELEKADHGAQRVYADLDKIQQGTAKDCKRLIVTRGEGPKAAKASSLREHDVVKGSQERIERIGRRIIDKIIVDFKKNYDVNNFFTGQFPSEDFPLSSDITTPSVGWVDDDGYVPEEGSQDRRENFLYELKRFVENGVCNTMLTLLQFKFNGESIWDNWEIRVFLRKQHGTDTQSVITEVFFTQIE